MDRRRALVTLAAAGAGVLTGGAPELLRLASPGDRRQRRAASRPTPTIPPDPAYAPNLRALQSPVKTLQHLTPAAPPNSVALTIDDGPHPRYTPMMLDVLAEFDVPATFNMIGTQVVEQPKLVQRIVADGHQVADHTVTHPLNMPALSAAKINEEIATAHDQIAQTCGRAPKLFRAPGGNWSQQVLDTAAQHGLISVDWQVDPRDWERPGSGSIAETLLKAQAGDVLLCHDGGGDRSQTIEALRTVLPALKQRGLVFVAL